MHDIQIPRARSHSFIAMRHNLDDEAFGDSTEIIVTPSIYPRVFEFPRGGIQRTEQTSRCVKTFWHHRHGFILIPAVYLRLFELPHIYIQRTGHKSRCFTL